MSFFKLSTGEALSTEKSYDADVQIAPMPDGTTAVAAIDEIKWNTYNNEEYIEARWCILDGEYKNRKVFQKMRVSDSDSAKRDKAIKMLSAIDNNAGGQIMALGKEPSNSDLSSCLANKPMAIKLLIWQIPSEVEGGKAKTGNWVCMVSPVNGEAKVVTPAAEAQQAPVNDLGENDLAF